LGSAVCSFGAVDNGLLALVPQNSQFVIGINVIAARDSEFGRYITARFNAHEKGLEQLDAATGFDPRRDLESVVFAGIPDSTGKPHMPGVLLARGTFNQSKIRTAALAKGAVVQNFSGVDFFLPGNGRGKKAFAFFDTNVFATGSISDLQQLAANRLAPVTLDPTLQNLITHAGTEGDIWFASTVPASQLSRHLQPVLPQSAGPASEVVQRISSASGGVKFGTNIQLAVDAIAQSDKDASSLVDVVRFLGSMVQMKSQSDPRAALFGSALNQLIVSAKGQNVHLSLSVPETTIEQLADLRSQQNLAH